MAMCWAYTDTGSLCGKLAVAVDPQRGMTVCAAHIEVRDRRGQEKCSSGNRYAAWSGAGLALG